MHFSKLLHGRLAVQFTIPQEDEEYLRRNLGAMSARQTFAGGPIDGAERELNTSET